MSLFLSDFIRNVKAILEKTFENKEGIFFRILSYFLSSIFFANIPTLLFLIYMGHYGFFSYDYFSEGIFGSKVFFLISIVVLLALSFMTFWWVVPLVEKIVTKKTSLHSFILILILNLIVFFSLVYGLYLTENLYKGLYFFVISFFLSLHMGILLYAKPSQQFISLFVMIFVITFMSIQFREQASSLVAIGLKTFSVGGEISVVLTPKFSESDTINGKLILTTPKHVYIKISGSRNISTIDRSKIDEITTINY
tara:strand:- start:1898 stop:2656 length:759 start_codon:yes stop_codon:yes gene_type:complete